MQETCLLLRLTLRKMLSSSETDNTSMTNKDENDKDQEMIEEQTSLVKKATRTRKNHPTTQQILLEIQMKAW